MPLLDVVNDVCAAVGVTIAPAVFANINANRTMQEMVALANEMAQRIATDTRDWTQLRKSLDPLFLGDGVTEAFDLPADYRRMLTHGHVWISSATEQPLRFIPNTDEWLQRRAANRQSSVGEWTIYGGQMHISPVMDSGVPIWTNNTRYNVGFTARDTADNTLWTCNVSHVSAPTGSFASDRADHFFPLYWGAAQHTSVRFSYLDKNCIERRDVNGMPFSPTQLVERFTSDQDTFRLPERILKLGMITFWKQLKGSPYAEDMGTYQDAISTAMGFDSPAPTLIDRGPPSIWGSRYAYY